MDASTTRSDMERIRALFGNLAVNPYTLPVSFTYAAMQYSGLPRGAAPQTRRLDGNMTETVLTARLDSTLRVTAEIITYHDFAAVEWTLWFENDGVRTSALLLHVNAADMTLPGASPRLISNNGDFCSIEGYTNTTTALDAGVQFTQSPRGGRACDGAFPYQRLLFDGHGYNIAIGWPGQWHCRWTGVPGGARFTAGQQEVRTVLRPGERFRTPRMTFVAFAGDMERGVNVWRRWYRAHVLPRVHGQPFPGLVQTGDNGGGIEFTAATEAQQLSAVAAQARAGAGAELWWMDAGWYPCAGDWPRTGTWAPDKERFPRGLAPVGAACREAGMDFLVWFEPERVRPGTWLARHHPKWLLRRDESARPANPPDENMLLNLADPDCLQWLCDYMSDFLRESGVTAYRQDFNFEPLPYWRENEAADRLGMLENQYIQGYLAYWDELLTRNPDLMIDSCASGGRRNDLESMRRAVPFHQTDFGYGHHPVKQKFGQLLYGWIPYFRGFPSSWDDEEGAYVTPDYYAPPARPSHEVFDMLNAFAPMMAIDCSRDIARLPDVPGRQRQLTALYKRVREHLLQDDFYALTPQHCSREQWSAWQFNSPSAGTGVMQFFRNNAAPQASFTARLRALRPQAQYLFENGLTGETRRLSGRAAMDEGFVESLDKRGASLWLYRAIEA